jgi:hypothetical protein
MYKQYKSKRIGFDRGLTKNKCISASILFTTQFSYLSFSLAFSRKCDHAGFALDISLPFICFDFEIYDCRHWDYDNNKYYPLGSDLSSVYDSYDADKK